MNDGEEQHGIRRAWMPPTLQAWEAGYAIAFAKLEAKRSLKKDDLMMPSAP
jgi:hypothetical protein